MNKSKQVAITGLFSAMIVVLQLMSYFIKIGTFNLSLVLIPLVIGAVLYGAKTGAVLGAVFGITVTLACVFGLDTGGYVLWAVNPFLTALVCIVKGVAAGYIAGLVGQALKGKNLYLACFLSAVCAPIVNTGLFILGMTVFFSQTLTEWAGGTDVLNYIIFGLVGINFLIELAVNVVFSPAITRVITAVKKI